MSEILETYMETTLSGSFISVGMGVVQLTRSLLVHATKGSDVLAAEEKLRLDKSTKLGSTSSSDTSLPIGDSNGLAVLEGFPSREDHPRTRAWIRWAALAIDDDPALGGNEREHHRRCRLCRRSRRGRRGPRTGALVRLLLVPSQWYVLTHRTSRSIGTSVWPLALRC